MLFSATAPFLPNSCFLCGNGSGPFADLQHDAADDPRDANLAVQFGAAYHLYLCVTCAMNAAQVVESASTNTIIARHVLEDERRIHREQAERTAEVMAENETLRAALGVIEKYQPAMAGAPAREESVDPDTVSTATPRPRKQVRR